VKKLGYVVIETALIDRLRELNAIHSLKSLPDGALKVFCGLLCKKPVDGGEEDFTPRAEFRSTGVASDETVVCHLVWSDEVIAAALAATRRHFDLRVIHEKAISESLDAV
jgi:hypothetical protein